MVWLDTAIETLKQNQYSSARVPYGLTCLLEGEAKAELLQENFRRGACSIKTFKAWFKRTFVKTKTKLDAKERIEKKNPAGMTIRQYLYSLTNDIATAEEKLKVDDLITLIKSRLPVEFRKEVKDIKFDFL
eukprot:Nk52_evm1s1455 gene=Nk52_evmTU1s1455